MGGKGGLLEFDGELSLIPASAWNCIGPGWKRHHPDGRIAVDDDRSDPRDLGGGGKNFG
jgi:hypothetical protein